LYGTENRTAETTFSFAGSSMTSGPEGLVPVAGTDFMVAYEITGGRLISITPDVDANSLIIAIDAISDGQLTITLPRELIDAKIGDEDDDFFVLVDGEEVDFDETITSTDRTLVISFFAGAEEIEIIGTHVVPEFGAIAALILAVAIISIIAVSAKSRLSIMPRY
jgi:predicted secreted protein with PEFG-CTERM motif